jgi:hypothetical protein
MPHLSLPRTKLVVALLMGCATASAVEAPAKPGTTEANGMALCSMEAGAFATGAVAPVDIDPASNSGRTSIALHNLSTAPCRVILQPGRVVDAFTTQPLSVAASLQKQGESAGSPFVELPLPAQGSTAVQLVLTGYRWPGQSRADVDVNGRKVSVSASFLNVPFNVGLQSAGSETAKVALVRRRDGMVVLKNDDAYGYNVAWRLFTADDSTVLNGSKVLPPKSSAPIAISPPAGWFRHPFRGFFRNDERAGYLTLEFAPPGLTSNAMQTPAAEGGAVRTASALHLPAKALPVQFDLAYWDSAKALGPAIIGIVLVFGAVLSMVMNLWIPNYTTRSQLQQRLDRLSSEIRQFSMSSDSRLRVGLRMESLRLKEALGRTWVSSLGGADEMKQFSMEVDALERRGRTAKPRRARSTTPRRRCRARAPPS